VNEDLYLVMRTVFHYERGLEDRFDLGYEEIYVLQYLRRHPHVHLNDVSHEMELPMFKCSRLISRLVEKKLVTKSQDSADRRGIQIVLMPEGEKVVKTIEEYSYNRINENSSGMSEEETSKLLLLIENIHRWLGVSDKIK
jgi:DNA-binding MarR family transcriptional regulator